MIRLSPCPRRRGASRRGHARMTLVERFQRTARSEPVDRLPLLEWAPLSERALSRWYSEGLSRHINDPCEVGLELGLDRHRQLRVFARAATCPPSTPHNGGLVGGADDYRALRGHLYPKPRLRADPAFADLRAWGREHGEGSSVVSLTLDGFFWYPRTLLGAERHFYALCDEPELVHAMNRDLVEYAEWAVGEVCRSVTPDFIVFTEDLSCDRGPVLSRQMFDEFLAPYYRRIVPALAQRGILPLVACDGDVTSAAGWFAEVGVRGLAPLERRAGVDPLALRARHPGLLLMGGIDCGLLGRSADMSGLRADLERLLPLMRSGGFLPCLDCRGPAEIALPKYRAYLGLLADYCGRAGAEALREPAAAAQPPAAPSTAA